MKALADEVCFVYVQKISGLKYTSQANRSLVKNNHKDSTTVALKHYMKHTKYQTIS